MNTPFFEGNRIYYSFIRPHMGLDGATPAEIAGISMVSENRWDKLLRRNVACKTKYDLIMMILYRLVNAMPLYNPENWRRGSLEVI